LETLFGAPRVIGRDPEVMVARREGGSDAVWVDLAQFFRGVALGGHKDGWK